MHSVAALKTNTTPATSAAHTGNRLLAAHLTACKQQILAHNRQQMGCPTTHLLRPIMTARPHAARARDTVPSCGPTVISLLLPAQPNHNLGRSRSPATPSNRLPTKPGRFQPRNPPQPPSTHDRFSARFSHMVQNHHTLGMLVQHAPFLPAPSVILGYWYAAPIFIWGIMSMADLNRATH